MSLQHGHRWSGVHSNRLKLCLWYSLDEHRQPSTERNSCYLVLNLSEEGCTPFDGGSVAYAVRITFQQQRWGMQDNISEMFSASCRAASSRNSFHVSRWRQGSEGCWAKNTSSPMGKVIVRCIISQDLDLLSGFLLSFIRCFSTHLHDTGWSRQSPCGLPATNEVMLDQDHNVNILCQWWNPPYTNGHWLSENSCHGRHPERPEWPCWDHQQAQTLGMSP